MSEDNFENVDEGVYRYQHHRRGKDEGAAKGVLEKRFGFRWFEMDFVGL